MSNKAKPSFGDNLNIIGAIASKDIVDALKNRVIVAMVLMLCFPLLVPKLLPYIFEQSQTVMPVYDMGNSALVADLQNATEFSVQAVHSKKELGLALCSGIYPEIGLMIPTDFNPEIGPGDQLDFQGFVCWSKRHQVAELQPKLAGMLSASLGRPVTVQIEGNILYPPMDGVLYLSLSTVNTIVLFLVIGIFTLPSLLLEEKETKTMQALLVSPASIAQVVTGKALAGSFYILVGAIIIFLISWVDVIHWDMVILFVIGSGIFSVAVGLVLGSLFDRPQDMVGWITGLLLALIGAVLIKALGLELPSFVNSILPWVPSVALAEIYRAALSETVSIPSLLTNFGMVLIVSVLLYAFVVYLLRRSDR